MLERYDLRVLFVNRDPDSWMGGDMIKMLNFKKHIEHIPGVCVEFTHKFDSNWDNYHIVHAFNLCWEWTRLAYIRSKIFNRPFVVSSIYFPNTYSDKYMEMVHNSDIIVFSEKEMKRIMSDFRIKSKARFHTIKNGVDSLFFSSNTERDIDVLCVGRISRDKRTKVVSKICKKHNLKFCAVGPGRSFGIKGETPGKLSHEELAKYYSRSKVVVQATTIEPYPNTLLEAGLAGCQYVLTDITWVDDNYPSIFWCDPYNKDTIESAILSALKRWSSTGVNTHLQKHVKQTYIWEKQAQRTIDLYRKILRC